MKKCRKWMIGFSVPEFRESVAVETVAPKMRAAKKRAIEVLCDLYNLSKGAFVFAQWTLLNNDGTPESGTWRTPPTIIVDDGVSDNPVIKDSIEETQSTALVPVDSTAPVRSAVYLSEALTDAVLEAASTQVHFYKEA